MSACRSRAATRPRVADGPTRRAFLSTSLLAGAGALLGCGRIARARPRAPSLVLIVNDTLRADHLGAYGCVQRLTPALDRLAQRGTVFRQCMSSAPLTAPAHCSLLTGAYQGRHGVICNGGTLAPGLSTLAERLAAVGYVTAAFVSNPVLRPSEIAGIDRGFTVYDTQMSEVERNRSLPYRPATDTVRAATSWLQQFQADQPFFLFVHLQEPHGPYDLPDHPRAHEAPARLPRADDPATLPMLAGNYGRDGIPAYQRLGDERDPSVYRARYAARVAYADAEVAELMAAVERTGRGDEALVVFTADHGELLGERGYYFQHGISVLQPVLHVPLILAGRDVPAGARRDALVGNTDVMPTVLDLLGVPIERRDEEVDGVSLVAMLRDDVAGVERPRYAFVDRDGEAAVYWGRYKLSSTALASGPGERLVDVVRDVAEERDLRAAMPEKARRLSVLLSPFAARMRPLVASACVRPGGVSDEQRRRLEALGYAH